ncbi:uncharacterized protein ARMOST_20568 [Armillaria ostoyae]|uniref:Heterokaryon incompatibility domain-containing protein n=1 Tax=Armillaria ostoyae TaxID=47428 RepID=A0A284S7P3_ARMOS|nr:uncharacterized protein ARMOST_20568 [Armillaria ostoyae]
MQMVGMPPEITISAFAETGQVESTIPVLKQWSYTGKCVISSTLADISCADLGVYGVLKKLNSILNTSYTLGSIISVLNFYLAQGIDFGTAYAYLSPYWNDTQRLYTIQHNLRVKEEEDRDMRKEVLAHDRITTWAVPPRRMWDLCANQVIPYWVVPSEHPWGISHAWVDERERVDMMTVINGNEWPVPMPKDTNLDLIWIKMLNHGAEYAWLDVLCLWQEGRKGKHLHKDEWKLDVPTIGYVYEEAYCVVCYFNGLGRPLHLTVDYFESNRCWFRHAWTLQEITPNPIIGGKTGDDMMEDGVQRRFNEQLTSLREMRKQNMALTLMSEMQHRASTKPLDKVAGVVYLLQTDSIPIYDPDQSAADAWEVLMDAMEPMLRTLLLFYYPEFGKGKKCWQPSWEHVMTNRVVVPSSAFFLAQVNQTDDPDADYYIGYHIELAHVQGFSKMQTESKP